MVPDDTRLGQLERRVNADPTSVAFAALAEEYRRVGRYQEVVDVSRKGLLRHPAYLSARVTLGRALLELGSLNEARTEFEFVLRAAPENLAAIRGLAEIHHRYGDLHETAEPSPAAPGVADPGESSSDALLVEPPAVDPARQPDGRSASAPDPALAALDRFLGAIQAARAADGRAGS